MNIMDGISIVGFIQFNNMSMSRFINFPAVTVAM